MPNEKPLVSIVIPAFNEAGNIERTLTAIQAETKPLAKDYDFEFLFIDDGSTDETFNEINRLSTSDLRLRAIRFSRNYGFQLAVYSGLLQARGSAVIQMDCDLQDPTSLIPKFLEKWAEGYNVVYGIRQSRKEGWFITKTRQAFYWLVDRLSEDHLPRDAGDCRLVDAAILRELRRINDPDIYVRGRISSFGFRQVGVPYNREARVFDESKFGIIKLTGLALDGIVSHSVIPLRLATILGLLLTLGSAIGIVIYVIAKLFFDIPWPTGFATLVTLVLFSMGLNGLFLGIMGEYIARIFKQLKVSGRPVIWQSVENGELSTHEETNSQISKYDKAPSSN